MYLSKLEIFGFKSFAQKAVFKFEDGITAIIGPNGCGKSNIVDAIRWVLGEQRPSVLRLDRMENIIFNGTATRKPLSLAEVSLYIENNKNILPSIYTEVKITRRLYRSGESEYLLNNRPVRLKDIIDLFADTGMGADAYSVIELKMVEQILSDNAEERRRLFEEAAGIKKYKLRRKSALRRLESTEQELVRLNDVIAEVQKTVNSLSRQVGKARRYHQFKNELKEKEIFAYQLRLQSYGTQLVPLRQEWEQVKLNRERLGKEVHQMEAELQKLQTRSLDLERMFQKVAGELNRYDEQIRQREEKVRLNEQRIQSRQENIRRNEQEITHLEKSIQELEQELVALEQEAGSIAAQAEELQNAYQQKANQQVEFESKVETARERYHQFREENRNLLETQNQKREEHQRLNIRLSALQERLEKLRKLHTTLEAEQQEKETALATLQEEVQEAREDRELYRRERDVLQQQLEELRNRIPPLEEEQNRLLGIQEKLKNRREFLERLITNYEGFSESVQYVMSRSQQFGGLIDTLANLVDTSEEYRPALESYLQEIANYLVVKEESTARDILQEIRRQKKGRLTLVPLSLLHPARNGSLDFSIFQGEAIPLKQVVRFEAQFETLFNFLFERVILVPDMESGLRWYKQYPQFNYLTREGEFIGDWGHITGGDSGRSLNLIGRKQEFTRVEKELQEVQLKLQQHEAQLAQLREDIRNKQSKLEEFTRLLEEQDTTVRQLEQKLHNQQYETTRLQERVQETSAEIHQLQEEVATLEREIARLQPELEEAGRQLQRFRETEERLNREVEEAEREYRQVVREVQELQREFLGKQNRLNELVRKQEYQRERRKEMQQRITRLREEIRDFEKEIQTFEEENAGLRRELEQLYEKRDAVEKEKDTVESQYQSIKSLIMAKEGASKKRHRLWVQAQERARELELQIRELEVKQKTLQEQLEEQFGEDLEKFLQEHPLPQNVTYQQLQEEVAALRKKIESLGEVNPLAVKEFEREKERLDFLKEQQADLLKAKSELLETIRKLNKTARTLFMETFQKISENFQKVFSKFFENGEGKLQLVESDDPLEANIDISVHIKGRNLSTLSMMSAGEKTLTAISLLFSIYLVKPSPFCILDEVDAPLDDVNIARYTHALKEFSDNTQFILVTHNKMTMQAAQAMYGITMEEPGVSKVVSVRLD